MKKKIFKEITHEALNAAFIKFDKFIANSCVYSNLYIIGVFSKNQPCSCSWEKCLQESLSKNNDVSSGPHCVFSLI